MVCQRSRDYNFSFLLFFMVYSHRYLHLEERYLFLERLYNYFLFFWGPEHGLFDTFGLRICEIGGLSALYRLQFFIFFIFYGLYTQISTLRRVLFISREIV